MKNIYKYAFIFTIILLVSVASGALLYKDENVSQTAYELYVIQENDYWLYEIQHNNRLFIRQEYVPVLSGKKRFKNKKDASTIGNIALKKLNNHNLPVISLNDLIENDIEYIEDE